MRRLGSLLTLLGGALLVAGLAAFVATQFLHAEAFHMRLVSMGGVMIAGFVLLIVGLFLRGRKRAFTEEETRDALESRSRS